MRGPWLQGRLAPEQDGGNGDLGGGNDDDGNGFLEIKMNVGKDDLIIIIINMIKRENK